MPWLIRKHRSIPNCDPSFSSLRPFALPTRRSRAHVMLGLGNICEAETAIPMSVMRLRSHAVAGRVCSQRLKKLVLAIWPSRLKTTGSKEGATDGAIR